MMRREHYNVIFYGDFVPGNTNEDVKNRLTRRFHMDAPQLERLFTHTPFLLKSEVTYMTALTYQILFEWTGLMCRIEPTIPISEQALRIPPEYCNVVFTGELREGYAVDDVKCNLMVFLHLTEKRIDELFAGHPVTLMQDVDSHPALKMQISFELAGAMCRLESVKHDPPPAFATTVFPEAQTPSVAVEHMRCPKCGFRQPRSRKCRHCGMYVDRYVKKPTVGKERRLKHPAPQTDAALKQELLYWGIGFSVFGALQWTELGIWAMSFIGIGLLNLLLRQHSGGPGGRGMFLVNGLALLGPGAWSLVTMLTTNLSLHANMGLRFGIGHVESSMLIGGFVLWRVFQIGVGIYALGRFRQYMSTPTTSVLEKNAPHTLTIRRGNPS